MVGGGGGAFCSYVLFDLAVLINTLLLVYYPITLIRGGNDRHDETPLATLFPWNKLPSLHKQSYNTMIVSIQISSLIHAICTPSSLGC